MPGGTIFGGDLASAEADHRRFDDDYFRDNVAESVDARLVRGRPDALHPYEGETKPQYTDFEGRRQVLAG